MDVIGDLDMNLFKSERELTLFKNLEKEAPPDVDIRPWEVSILYKLYENLFGDR